MNQDDQAIAALARYEEVQAARDLVRAEYDAARAVPHNIIAPAVAALEAQIAALESSILPALTVVEEQYEDRLNGMDIAVNAAETNVRIAVLVVAKSVKGTHLHAVYTQGRTSWDSRGLDGYAVAYPEVLKFRSIGEPSVSIRAAK